MASALYEQIQCAICLCDFTDPVSLPCEHSFCRLCILGHLQACSGQSSCPECRQQFTKDDLRPSRLLRNVIEAIQDHLKEKQSTAVQNTDLNTSGLVCAEHDEKLRLFCETDQTLMCVICRDGTKHQGHQYKPVKEVVSTKKDDVKRALEILSTEYRELNDLVKEQTAEIEKSKVKSNLLSGQISSQFEELHHFLRKKEEEIKKQLEMEEKRCLEPMEEKKTMIETLLKEGKRDQDILKSALNINQPEIFLKWWNEKGLSITENIQKKETLFLGEEDDTLLLKDTNFMVIPDSLSLGPYESHLQFFVWKEMLKSIKPVAECFTISPRTPLIVSPDGLSVRQRDIDLHDHEDIYSNETVSAEETFTTGQHYWELEVGQKPDWTVGVEKRMEGANLLARLTGWKHCISKVHLRLKHDQGYVLNCNDIETPILTDINTRPRKIGLYLDCERNEVHFYNADNMSLIHKFTCSFQWPWSVSLWPGPYLRGTNSSPLSVCCYTV
ncbi:nuclear factor 7, brain-like [Colossoma macropomum]|uniref:nuclear factor 7, brain-like n=1 Tax=Colossoma macropomum TaxID=42526 RepID=UPI001864EF30|nr:nuclear factor 7, brain-like [Colossoma macropomum]